MPLFPLFLLNVTSLLLVGGAVVFFLRRDLWGRAGTATLVAAALCTILWRTAGGAIVVVLATPRSGLRLALVSTALFVPLIATEFIRRYFLALVRTIEDLLIKANDTNEWSLSWRDDFVDEHRAAILSSSTAIQREYIRRRRAPVSPLAYFATIVLGEDRRTMVRYITADREEPWRQLELVRGRTEGEQ
ncbi:MAG: hypothetical protein ACHQ9S_19360 [Candidatus Binatia bacterium]